MVSTSSHITLEGYKLNHSDSIRSSALPLRRPHSQAIQLWCLLLFCCFSTFTSASEVPSLLADLADGMREEDTFQSLAAASDDALLFWADDGRRGSELWITDGTPEGTRLWAEVCPGDCQDANPQGHSPEDVVFDGQEAYFLYDDGLHGRELWTVDRDQEMARLVADLCPGPCDPAIEALSLIDGRLFFAAKSNHSGIEPWTSDGTKEGTKSLGDLEPGSLGSNPHSFLPLGNGAAFQATTTTHGTEWWISDGTPNGTRLLADLCPGPCSTEALDSLANQEGVFFTSAASTDGETLYLLKPGTAPLALTQLCSGDCGSDRGTLFPVGDLVYAERNNRLWISDGTISGTRHLLDLPGATDSLISMVALESGTVLMMTVEDEVCAFVWRLDGAELSSLRYIPGAGPRGLAAIGNRAIFAQSFASLYFLQTDGSLAGTNEYAEMPTERQWELVEPPIRVGQHAVFVAKTPGPFGLKVLYSTQGEANDLQPLLDIEERPISVLPSELTAAGSRVVYRMKPEPRDPATDVWSVDAFGQTQRLIKPAYAEDFVTVDLAIGRRAFFKAYSPSSGFSPWLSDGTLSGTTLLADDFTGQILYEARDPTVLEGQLFFLAEQGFGQEIWRTDGVHIAELVIDLQPDWLNIHQGCSSCTPPSLPTPIFPRELRATGPSDDRRLVFVGDQEGTGSEIWQSDGTPEGTSILFDLKPGEEGSEPESLTPAGDGLAFIADDGTGRSLWLWDGHGAPNKYDDIETILASLSWGREAIWIDLQDGRFSIRRSDGTLNGTLQIALLPEGTVPDGRPVISGDRLFFVAADELGAELWVSDLNPGTAQTRIVTDLWPGAHGSYPKDLRIFEQQLYFSADDGVHGRELWRLDTRRSTLIPRRLGEIAPGIASSSPSQTALMVPENEEDPSAKLVVFTADDGISGREIWSVPLPESSEACVPDTTTLCLQDGRFRVSVVWQDSFNGTSGIGRTLPGTDESGFFWFFNATNLELAVKIIDGRDFNNAHWFFYGALSDVSYQISVEDLDTGQMRIYTNPQGSLCGQADIDAFPDIDPRDELMPFGSILTTQDHRLVSDIQADKTGSCTSTATSPCLLDRFQVTVDWRDHSGNQGQGRVASENLQTALFWFFGPENIELAVKLIDGGSFNDHFWVFYGALSDIEYTVRALDTMTGEEKVYHNPAGEFCGQGDTAAFPALP